MKTTAMSFVLGLLVVASPSLGQQVTVLQKVTVIDGTGKPARQNQDVAIKGDRILSIGPTSSAHPSGAKVVDMSGKTVMPAMINAHGHFGLLKGTTMASANYTEENIRRQLLRYQAYGVGAVLCMGTDHEEIFALRDASRRGTLPGPPSTPRGWALA